MIQLMATSITFSGTRFNFNWINKIVFTFRPALGQVRSKQALLVFTFSWLPESKIHSGVRSPFFKAFRSERFPWLWNEDFIILTRKVLWMFVVALRSVTPHLDRQLLQEPLRTGWWLWVCLGQYACVLSLLRYFCLPQTDHPQFLFSLPTIMKIDYLT